MPMVPYQEIYAVAELVFQIVQILPVGPTTYLHDKQRTISTKRLNKNIVATAQVAIHKAIKLSGRVVDGGAQ